MNNIVFVITHDKFDKLIEMQESKGNEYEGHVYVIECENYVKIGCTKNPYERIKEVTHTLRDYGMAKINRIAITQGHTNYRENEKIIHKIYSKNRHSNTELFNVSFDVVLNSLFSDIVLKDEIDSKTKKVNEQSENLMNTITELCVLNKPEDVFSNIFSKMSIDAIETAIERLNDYRVAKQDLEEYFSNFI